MKPRKHIVLDYIALCVAFIFLEPSRGLTHAQIPNLSRMDPQPAPTERDAQRDFDWDIGTWNVHVKRLLHPLTGSTTWIEYSGIDVVRKVWGGRANLGEVEWDGPAGHLEFLTLRLYNPQTHKWSINVANSKAGTLSPPAIGEFKEGRGEFYDQEDFNGTPILVRINISDVTENSCRFEQAFSADWGKTWEVNLITTETLVKNETH